MIIEYDNSLLLKFQTVYGKDDLEVCVPRQPTICNNTQLGFTRLRGWEKILSRRNSYRTDIFLNLRTHTHK